MIRRAKEEDAEELYVLNDEFNGIDGTTIDSIKSKIELLTGKENYDAQALYRKQGYTAEDEMLFVKRM